VVNGLGIPGLNSRESCAISREVHRENLVSDLTHPQVHVVCVVMSGSFFCVYVCDHDVVSGRFLSLFLFVSLSLCFNIIGTVMVAFSLSQW
jgi:hypothetical protein